MLGSKNNTFFKRPTMLKVLRGKVEQLLELKERSYKDIQDYLQAFDFFVKNPTKFDGATIVKDLNDLPNLDLDAMLHDYEYIQGANLNFIKKWKADIRYICNMEKQGKGIRVARFIILTLIGIIYVPYNFIKYLFK